MRRREKKKPGMTPQNWRLKKGRQVFQEKNRGATPSVAAPGVTHPSDATAPADTSWPRDNIQSQALELDRPCRAVDRVRPTCSRRRELIGCCGQSVSEACHRR